MDVHYDTDGIWFQWVLAHSLGFILGGILGAIAELGFYDNTFSGPVGRYTIAGDQTVALGMILGVTMSIVGQSASLRQRTAWGIQWLLTAIIVAIAGMFALVAVGFVGGLRPLPTTLTVVLVLAIVLGLAAGLTQFIILHGRVARAYLWPPIVLFVWIVSLPVAWLLSLAVGLPISFAIGQVLDDSIVGGVAAALFMVAALGILSGILLGLGLKWLMRRPVPAPA